MEREEREEEERRGEERKVGEMEGEEETDFIFNRKLL